MKKQQGVQIKSDEKSFSAGEWQGLKKFTSELQSKSNSRVYGGGGGGVEENFSNSLPIFINFSVWARMIQT